MTCPVPLLRILLLIWGSFLGNGSPAAAVFDSLGPSGPLRVDRRQIEQLPAPLPEPSCAQLRAMWRQMHRMARHSQLTNEIPQFPAAYPFGYVAPDVGNKAVYFYPGAPGNSKAAFGKIVRKPERGRTKVRPRPVGRFADTPLPRAALGSYGTLVRSPDEKEQLRRQQEGPEFGVWGAFPGDATSSASRAAATVLAEDPDSRTPSFDKKLEWCRRTVLTHPCKTHQDCFCPRTKFFCSAGRCRSSPVRKATKDQWGSWYSGPLESSRLGLSRAGSPPDPPASNNI